MNKLIEAMVAREQFSNDPNAPKDVNYSAVDDAIAQIKSRFIDERTNGWEHPETGQYHAPVSRQDAERRWAAVEPKFRQVLLNPDEQADRRLRLKKTRPTGVDYYDTEHTKPSNWDAPAGTPKYVPKEPVPAEVDNTDWSDYERSWTETPYERGMREEPSLRRGESKAAKIVNKMIG